MENIWISSNEQLPEEGDWIGESNIKGAVLVFNGDFDDPWYEVAKLTKFGWEPCDGPSFETGGTYWMEIPLILGVYDMPEES